MKVGSSILVSKEENPNNKANGRWTKEEHERFVEGIRRFGKNWKKVEEFMGTRNGAQIRSHAQKFFLRIQREERSEDSDSKSLKEKLRSTREVSDFSESTTVLAHENALIAEGESESKKDTTDCSPIRTEAPTKTLESQKELRKLSSEEDCDDSQKVLEIYCAMRKFLGLPENEFDLNVIAPFSSSRSGYFSQCFNSNQFSAESIQNTKLSDLLAFCEKEEKSQQKITAPSLAPGSRCGAFRLASSHAGNEYMQRKLTLLRQAPMLESSPSLPKRLKASINDG